MSLVSTVVNKDQGDTLTYNLVQKFPLQMWKLRLKLPRDSHFHGKQTKNCFSLWVSLVCSTSFTRNLGYYTVKQIDSSFMNSMIQWKIMWIWYLKKCWTSSSVLQPFHFIEKSLRELKWLQGRGLTIIKVSDPFLTSVLFWWLAL